MSPARHAGFGAAAREPVFRAISLFIDAMIPENIETQGT